MGSALAFIKEGIQIGPFFISEDFLNDIVSKGFRVVLVVFMMIISIKLGNRVINKFVERQDTNTRGFFKIPVMSPQKAKTIGEVLKSILKYAVYIIGVLILISIFFGEITLAFASIGGFAIGFGAQSLVQDLINGFFILFEDQYGVCDHVTIGKFSGIIESIGIRTTILKDFNGDLHLIPNGNIKEVTNHSRNDIRFMVDVEIAYEEDIDNAIDIITKACRKFEKEHDCINKPIDIWGVTDLNSSGVNIRVVGFSEPLKQWSMERALRKKLKEALDKSNIEIPYQKSELIIKSKETVTNSL